VGVQIFLVLMLDAKLIYGLFNVRIVVQHFHTLIVRKKQPKLGTGGLTMAEYIKREALINELNEAPAYFDSGDIRYGIDIALHKVIKQPVADVVEVVRCKDCKFAIELDKHCEINRTTYKHCTLLRGDETKYVWHKYKKYYKDYSIVELDEFCSYGERVIK
jgi:hypothetical protein